MKKTFFIFLCILLVFASGCRDKQAREYAEHLSEVLRLYAEQIAAKIKAEETSYRESEKIYGSAREDEVFEVLRYERIERTNRTIDALAAMLGNKPRSADPVLDQFAPLTLAKLQDDLRAYGQLDFEATRGLLEQELSARKRYLNNLQSLQFELSRVKALRASLSELAQAKSSFQQVKDLADFIKETNQAYNKLACDDLTNHIKALASQKTTLEKEVKDAKALTAKAVEAVAAAAAADKPQRESELRKLQLAQEKLEAKLAAVNQTNSELTERKQKRSCQ